MKKVVSLLLILVIGVSFAGCGSKAKLNSTNAAAARLVIKDIDKYLAGDVDGDYLKLTIELAKEMVDEDDDASAVTQLTTALVLASSNVTLKDNGKLEANRKDLAKLAGYKD